MACTPYKSVAIRFQSDDASVSTLPPDATPHKILHHLWTKAVGASNYNKSEWKLLEAAMREILKP